MDPDPATVKFAQALPFVLLPASSQLAALHTARARVNVPAACSRCGADATFQRTRITRSKQPRSSQATRMVSTSCIACNGVVSTPFQSGTIPSSSRKPIALAVTPSQLVAQASSSEVNVAPLPVSHQVNLAPKSASPAAVVRENGPAPPPAKLGPSSSKNKKKSGLQQMLERNREKEKHKAKAADAKQPSGLSAFLSNL